MQSVRHKSVVLSSSRQDVSKMAVSHTAAQHQHQHQQHARPTLKSDLPSVRDPLTASFGIPFAIGAHTRSHRPWPVRIHPDCYPVPNVPMNPWEYNALDHNYPDDTNVSGYLEDGAVADSIHYPGIYAPSGFDIMNILSRVMSRPSPVIQLGPVDASCALVVCDLMQPDYPIVYANEACAALTGYAPQEMIGRNCRFLQAPPGPPPQSGSGSGSGSGGRASRRRPSSSSSSSPSSPSAGTQRNPPVDRGAVRRMRRAVDTNAELAVEVTNFKRDGTPFTNVITMIPICWDTPAPRYYVGFMAEKTW